MAAAADRGPGTGVLIALGVAGVGYYAYKHWLKPGVLVPIETKHQVMRMQITNAKVGLDIKGKKLWLSFVINNPNNQPMRITAIVGHATVYQSDPKKPGLRIGDVDEFKPIEIRPTAATPVKLTFNLKAFNSIAYLVQVLTGAWKGQFLDFQGTINANNRPWPIHERIKMSQ